MALRLVVLPEAVPPARMNEWPISMANQNQAAISAESVPSRMRSGGVMGSARNLRTVKVLPRVVTSRLSVACRRLPSGRVASSRGSATEMCLRLRCARRMTNESRSSSSSKRTVGLDRLVLAVEQEQRDGRAVAGDVLDHRVAHQRVDGAVAEEVAHEVVLEPLHPRGIDPDAVVHDGLADGLDEDGGGVAVARGLPAVQGADEGVLEEAQHVHLVGGQVRLDDLVHVDVLGLVEEDAGPGAVRHERLRLHGTHAGRWWGDGRHRGAVRRWHGVGAGGGGGR